MSLYLKIKTGNLFKMKPFNVIL